ncbi:hypothetical protein ALC56_06321 [Trachymyrmex septentrionalis]|uniref:Double jelly roll-like domain-containing protein n=1 Tax=Trachymyrmex septentrionalis TaxID=34720 RepID=A0A151JX00_9HYME|nr:hypothetical protein ALC56_06321 [Trachymyrmex septentrionalis]
MSRDILNIEGEPIFDDRIVKIKTYTYNPYAKTTFGYSDEIRIRIQHQDLYTLSSKSFLYVEGKFSTKKRDGNTSEEYPPRLSNNCVAFMFEIRYELDGMEIDRSRNVGITSMIKNFVLLTTSKSIESTEPKITLLKRQWKMPHVVLNDVNKLSLLRTLESGRYLSMCFRSWDLYEFPLLQSTTKHSWAVKTTSQLEKSRYVENCKENIPLNTTVYCLIIHDRVIVYNSLTNVIRKIV